LISKSYNLHNFKNKYEFNSIKLENQFIKLSFLKWFVNFKNQN